MRTGKEEAEGEVGGALGGTAKKEQDEQEQTKQQEEKRMEQEERRVLEEEYRLGGPGLDLRERCEAHGRAAEDDGHGDCHLL